MPATSQAKTRRHEQNRLRLRDVFPQNCRFLEVGNTNTLHQSVSRFTDVYGSAADGSLRHIDISVTADTALSAPGRVDPTRGRQRLDRPR